MSATTWPLLVVKDFDGTILGYHYRGHYLARTEGRRTWSVYETDGWTGAPLRDDPLTTDAPTRAQARAFVDALVEAGSEQAPVPTPRRKQQPPKEQTMPEFEGDDL